MFVYAYVYVYASLHCAALLDNNSMNPGPFAFIYYHPATQSVVYGRDPFGRRSLVGLRAVSPSPSPGGEGEGEGDRTERHGRGGHLVIASTAVTTSSSPSLSSSSSTSSSTSSRSSEEEEVKAMDMVWEELSVEGVYAQRLGLLQTEGPAAEAQVQVQAPWPASRLLLGGGQSTASAASLALSRELLRTDLSLEEASMNCASTSSSSSNSIRAGAAGDPVPTRLQQEAAASEKFLALMMSVLRTRLGLVHQDDLLCPATLKETCCPKAQAPSLSTTETVKKEQKPESSSSLGQEEEQGASTSTSTSPVGVLFSGGIDSVFLTAVLHHCMPSQNSIDLINVSFDGPASRYSKQSLFVFW